MRMLLPVLLALSSGAPLTEPPPAASTGIIGEWANSAVGLVRFGEDGHFHLDRRDGNYHLDGMWSVAGNRITLTTPAMTDTCFFKRIDGLLSIFGRCRSNMILVPLPHSSEEPVRLHAFLGRWANEGMRKTEFLPDGSFSILGYNGVGVRGHWTLVDDSAGPDRAKTGRFALEVAGQPIVCDFSADQQTLSLKGCGGLTGTLIRLPE